VLAAEAFRPFEEFGPREFLSRAGILASWGPFIVLADLLLFRAAARPFEEFGPRALLSRAGIFASWGPFIVLVDVLLFRAVTRPFEAFGPRALLVLADVLLVVQEAAGPLESFGLIGLFQ
jgi:hypothetical protein